jgi:hypothetical protein
MKEIGPSHHLAITWRKNRFPGNVGKRGRRIARTPGRHKADFALSPGLCVPCFLSWQNSAKKEQKERKERGRKQLSRLA